MSVFETIAIRGGGKMFFDEHLVRLERACRAADFPWPPGLARAAAALPAQDGMLRLYVTAGDGAPLDPAKNPRAFAFFEEASFPNEAALARGMRVGISRVPVSCVLGGWKTANYWPHVQAMAAARREGCEEALVFNAAGALVSAAMANVVVVVDGILRTPALEAGARDGVVRGWVGKRRPFEEALLTLEDVERAVECFVTNSRVGVMPVTAIAERRLPSRQTGDWLAALYREETGSR